MQNDPIDATQNPMPNPEQGTNTPVTPPPVQTTPTQPPVIQPMQTPPVQPTVVQPIQNSPTQPPTIQPQPQSQNAKPKNTGLIVGLVITGIVAVAAVVGVVLYFVLKPSDNNSPNNSISGNSNSSSFFNEHGNDYGQYDYDQDDDEQDDYWLDDYWQNYYGRYDDGQDDYKTDNSNSNKVLSKCSSASDCIKKLDTENGITVEQYNTAIGFKGVLDKKNEFDTIYVWDFSNGDKLYATFSKYIDVTIDVDYNYSAHTSSAVNLAGYNTVRDRISTGISYNELKAALGGIDGLLYKRGYYYTDYLWIGASTNTYLTASVDEDNMVMSVYGAIESE